MNRKPLKHICMDWLCSGFCLLLIGLDVYLVTRPVFDLNHLPIQACTIGILFLLFYSAFGIRFCFDLACYWCAAGVFNALVFPDLPQEVTLNGFLYHVLGHLIPFLFVCYYLFNRKLLPPLSGPFYAIVAYCGIGYTVMVPLNFYTGANYFYLMGPPGFESLPLVLSLCWGVFISSYLLILNLIWDYVFRAIDLCIMRRDPVAYLESSE